MRHFFNPCKVGTLNPTTWGPKSTKLGPKIHQSRHREASEKGLGRLCRPLGGVLGASWVQDGPKTQKCSKIQTLVPAFRGQVGAQNRSKIDLETIQEVIIFLIVFGIDFWSDLEPIGLHLDPQNLPKMESSWLPKWIQKKYKK